MGNGPGQVVGQVGWQACWGGVQDGRRAIDLWSKEYSRVNVRT